MTYTNEEKRDLKYLYEFEVVGLDVFKLKYQYESNVLIHENGVTSDRADHRKWWKRYMSEFHMDSVMTIEGAVFWWNFYQTVVEMDYE